MSLLYLLPVNRLLSKPVKHISQRLTTLTFKVSEEGALAEFTLTSPCVFRKQLSVLTKIIWYSHDKYCA